jgi:hypothetical protein
MVSFTLNRKLIMAKTFAHIFFLVFAGLGILNMIESNTNSFDSSHLYDKYFNLNLVIVLNYSIGP